MAIRRATTAALGGLALACLTVWGSPAATREGLAAATSTADPVSNIGAITFSAGLAAPTTNRSLIIVFDLPTRWDAWAQATELADWESPRDVDGRRRKLGDQAAQQAEAAIATAAASVIAEIEGSGGTVLSRYDAAVAGILALVPPQVAPRLLGMPHVKRLRPAPIAAVSLADSVPSTGAPRVHDEMGVDGRGVTIAIADTGVDYTHAVFDGPGTTDAYEAAKADRTNSDTTWQGRRLYPSQRVVAGHDFVGELYTPDCTDAGEAQGKCTRTPQPDPDPLDVHGHGTHVASIAAGGESPPVSAGMAPGADIVALKIFGSSGLTELIVDPIEWAVEANLGAPGRPRIDVINLSLGQRYGTELLEEEAVVSRAAQAGIVVVASAGNDSNLPFVAAAPAVAADALAVASHRPPGSHVWNAEITTPPNGEPLPVFGQDSTYLQDWSPDPRGELAAPLVYVGRGCPGDSSGTPADPLLADPKGAIAMFDMAWGSGGPECTVDRQARRLQDEGAIAALMAAGIGLESASWWDAEPIVDIPVWMVDHTLEQAIKEWSQVEPADPSDEILRMRLYPVYTPSKDLVVSAFSSRGPARTTILKPDLSAPGEGIFAAAVGQGTRGVAHSGTSMSAPHVSGAAALVWQRSRQLGRELSARDVAAALVTSADPEGVRTDDSSGFPPPLTRVGAGALDAWAASTTDTIVRSESIAAINLGVEAYVLPVTSTHEIKITNLSTVPKDYELAPRFRSVHEEEAGLFFYLTPDKVTVPAGASTTVRLETAIDPTRLPYWDLLGGRNVGDQDLMAQSELDGWIEVTELAAGPQVDGDQDPDADDMAAVHRVPFFLLARWASRILADWGSSASERRPAAREPADRRQAHRYQADGPVTLDLVNRSGAAGDVELFSLIATDPPDPLLPPKVDLDAVGVRTRPDDQGNTIVEFALHTRGVRIYPLETESLVQIDVDFDDLADYIVYTEDEEFLRTGVSRNGRVKVALEPVEGPPFGSPVTDFYAFVDLRSRFTVLPITIEHTGLTPSTLTFQFRVQQRDFVEKDAYRDPQYDQVPGGGGWLTFDGRMPAPMPAPSQASIDGREDLQLEVQTGGAQEMGLMALFPMNEPGEGDISLYFRPRPLSPVVLPLLLQRGP